MKGKTILITGANSGIGKEAAKELAKMGANLVIVCRNKERGEKAVKEIKSYSANEAVELYVCDLSKQTEIRDFARAFSSEHSRLDVLINNAGTVYMSYGETEEGIERTMAVNYFAPFLLTNLLLDMLIKSAPSRIINVASDAHFSGHIDLTDINSKKNWNPWRAYANSKLALVLFTYELARRLKDKGVTVNCLHPGAVRTNIWTHTGILRPFMMFASLFMKSPRKGAETIIYLASSQEVEHVTGKYFVNNKARPSSKESYDSDLAIKLWQLSMELTKLSV